MSDMSMFVIILWSSLFITPSLVGFSQGLDSPIIICPNTTYFLPDSTYEGNLRSVLFSLSSYVQRGDFFHTVAGNRSNTVYGLFLCRGDKTANDCNDCISEAVDNLFRSCALRKVAIIWFPQCMVRYSNKSFIGTVDESPGMYKWNGLYDLDHYTANTTAFWKLMQDTVGNVAKQAAGSGKKYATKEANFGASLTEYQTLHSLAQCTLDLPVNDCNTCLQDAIKNLSISCYLMLDDVS